MDLLYDIIAAPIRLLRALTVDLAERRWFMLPADAWLHLVVGGLIVYLGAKKWGMKNAWLVLIVATFAKEFVDIFVHAGIDYMGSWTVDTTADIVCSIAGGVVGTLFLPVRPAPGSPAGRRGGRPE
jgi:hypothetical protein